MIPTLVPMFHPVIWVLSISFMVLSILMVKYPTYFFNRDNQRMNGQRMSGNIVFLVAHPDDESMFFGPTILSLMRQRRGREKVYILCLSIGDYYGEGSKRKRELVDAAAVFGIRDHDVVIVDNQEYLKDGSVWNAAVVYKILQDFVTKHSISNIVTFDEYGVSGHHNHSSLFFAAKRVPGVSLFSLESVSILRKYLSILDIPISLIYNLIMPSKSWIEMVSLEDYLSVLRVALFRHSSQMVWYRRLYSIFSRYMFINSFEVYK